MFFYVLAALLTTLIEVSGEFSPIQYVTRGAGVKSYNENKYSLNMTNFFLIQKGKFPSDSPSPWITK
jgi:hypothetical protein